MKEKRRKELLKHYFRLPDGERCSIGGWRNSAYATVAPDSGGFFSISWQALKRAKENNEPIRPDAKISSIWVGV